MLKVWQIPIELELDDNMEEMQREYEQKLKEKEIYFVRKGNLQSKFTFTKVIWKLQTISELKK